MPDIVHGPGGIGYTGPGIPDVTRVANPRQPDTNNYLATNYFQLEITRLPTVTYFCQSVNLPGVSLSPVDLPTALGTRPKFVGGAYDFEQLSVQFMVDENMKNWLEVFDWMKSIGNMEDYDSVIASSQTQDFFSNITIMIMNSTYKPKYYVRIKEAIPISLSGIDFTSVSSETEPVIATATFAYMSYDIKTIENVTGTS